MRILVDMDSTAVDFFDPLVRIYNERTNEGISVADFKTWEMSNHVKNGGLLTAIFHEKGFFEFLKPMEGALEALTTLKAAGHEVVIVTSPCTPHSAAEKIIWCKEYLHPLGIKDLIITSQKHMVIGDVLIDDGLHNAVAYRKAWPDSYILTISHPYNDDGNECIYDERVPSWDYPKGAWEAITTLIMEDYL